MPCDAAYVGTPSGGIDLRLQRPKKVSVEFTVGAPLLRDDAFAFEPLGPSGTPNAALQDSEAPLHLSRELMTYFPSAGQGGLILDLGCGSGVHKQVCERAGFEYVGLDYTATDAMIVGDGHALPFGDQSFEAIVSLAVLEHLQFPFVALQEAYRVLKPGGKLLGTVAFLEPFHGDSYYHHTHLGTYNSLRSAGFSVERVAPSVSWSVLVAQARMGYFPRMPRSLATAIVLPVQMLHQVWWALAKLVTPKARGYRRVTHFTGSFAFVASRPASEATT
jgi:SAM-dependent methyltransferase